MVCMDLLYLMNDLSENDFRHNLPEVLKTIANGKGYYAKNAIKKMPKDVIAVSLSQ